MKIVSPTYFSELEITEDVPVTLVIEKGSLFRSVINSMVYQKDRGEGDFVLFDQGIILDFSKAINIITDLFHIGSDNKQMRAKVLQLLKNEYTDSSELADIVKSLNHFAAKICRDSTLPITMDEVFAGDLLKFLDFRIDLQMYEDLELLLEYCSLCREITDQKLVVIIGLKDFLDIDEYKQFIEMVCYKKIPMLLVERRMHPGMDDPKYLKIIDSDLCEL